MTVIRHPWSYTVPRGSLARKALLSITSETSIADHALAEVSIFLSKVNINAIYIIKKKIHLQI